MNVVIANRYYRYLLLFVVMFIITIISTMHTIIVLYTVPIPIRMNTAYYSMNSTD